MNKYPQIIDEQGKMHIDWTIPYIFKSIIPISGLYLMQNDD